MPRALVIASALFTPDPVAGPCALLVQDGRIQSIVGPTALNEAEPAAQVVADLRPWRLAPGYVDLHTHGFLGRDVTYGTQADIAAMAAALPASGVTAFLPTIASTPPPNTLRQVEAIAAAMRTVPPQTAEILGIRLEGPFISHARKGAQNDAAIRSPDPAELARLAAHGPIKIVDFAPEQDSDLRLLAALIHHRIVASIGHTDATFDQVVAALDAGATHCTHLFNAMPPLDHRAPGAAGALLTDPRATLEIIADGVHLHPAALRLAVAARGPRSTALITDAMSAAGAADGRYMFLGRQVRVADGAVRLPDGTLAGSVLTLDQAVRNMVALVGLTWSDAIRMATLTPATIARVADRKGALRPGADADFVALDQNGYVRQTWRAGQPVYSAS